MSVGFKRLPSSGERGAAVLNIARRPQTLVILLVSFILILVTFGTVYLTDIEILSPSTWTLSPNYQPDPPKLQPPLESEDGYGKIYDEELELNTENSAKVIGLVFFGRRELVEILDCYLQRNLKANGGLLDEVIFVVNTEIPEDLDYLNELIPSQKQYRTFIPDATLRQSKQDFSHLWVAVTEKDAIYIKIDDDTVGSHLE